MCLCSPMCVCVPVAAIYPFAWSNTSTFNDRSNIKHQHEGRVCQIHLPLSSPVCWFSIYKPQGRHFLFLAGVLTPLLALSGALGYGTMLFTSQRALCAESQHGMAGWAREQPAAHSYTHPWIRTNTHVIVPGGWQRCLPMLQSLHMVDWESWTERQTDTDIHNPSNYNLPAVLSRYNRTGNVKLWVWWRDSANTHEGYGKFTMTGHDSPHLGELHSQLDSIENISSGGLSSVRTFWEQVV